MRKHCLVMHCLNIDDKLLQLNMLNHGASICLVFIRKPPVYCAISDLSKLQIILKIEPTKMPFRVVVSGMPWELFFQTFTLIEHDFSRVALFTSLKIDDTLVNFQQEKKTH